MADTIEAKIEKLLRVADGTANENESAVALQMAQKLADLHNLDIGMIGKTGARADQNISKGLYTYQRTLYSHLAEINHCRVWITKGLVKGSKYQTRLLGSKVNVTMVCNMADYVEEVANRLVRDRFEPRAFFSKDAHTFREGFVDEMVLRIKRKRQLEEEERQRQKREQEARNRHPGAATENAIVLISDVAREEEKANYDYLNGDGAWDRKEARIAARIAERERELNEAAERYEQWALANPDKVAEREAEMQKAAESRRKREARLEAAREKRRQDRINQFGYDPQDYKSSKPSKYDSEIYWQGREEGEKVNLDDQIEEETREALS